jgi:UDP-N-acetylmuramate--alanine ligase
MVVEAALRSGHKNVHYCPDWHEAPALLAEGIGPGDVVVTLGAGDIFRLARKLVGKEEA